MSRRSSPVEFRHRSSPRAASSARRAFRARSRRATVLWAVATVSVVALLVVGGYGARWLSASTERSPRKSSAGLGAGAEAPPISLPQTPFTDVTLAAGVDFVHEDGARGEKLLPETMGGGCAFLDFDGDGDQDLLLVNSSPLLPAEDSPSSADRPVVLYRNDGIGNFEDATPGSGLDAPLKGMGVAVGDFDNDGAVDIFLSAVGKNRLYRNLGGGKFLDVTTRAGVAGSAEAWSTGCGWLDYDRDGDLDLFVCNYLTWSREIDLAHDFRFANGNRAYGRPQSFRGAFPYLYRNDGDGRFTDASAEAGIEVRDPRGEPAAKALGVTFTDCDHDGWIDIIVGNDTVPNHYLRNRRDGTFEELALMAGIAVAEDGAARGAMGVDATHPHNDDRLAIAIGNFAHEMAALFVSHDALPQFTDVAPRTALGPNTYRQLTFGTCFVDVDLDGRQDLFFVNGHLEPDIRSVQPDQRYQQSPQIFWNAGANSRAMFIPMPGETLTTDFSAPIAGRGAAYADIDSDGDVDLLITAVGDRPRLLRNDQATGHHWLRLRLNGRRDNRSAIGALVEVRMHDRTLRRRVMPTRSYLTQVELPLTFGLGADRHIESVRIHWPDGTEQTVTGLVADQTHNIEQELGIVSVSSRSIP